MTYIDAHYKCDGLKCKNVNQIIDYRTGTPSNKEWLRIIQH
jgi:protein tyrosine/serine phosphatase